MSNFSKIKAALSVADKTAEYELSCWTEEPAPVLILRPAGIENQAFFNASLRSNASATRGKKLSEAEMIEGGIREMRELWPVHVIAGWRNVKSDDTNAALDYTPELGREFLEALPVDELLKIKAFAQEMSNFRGVTGTHAVDAAALTGN